MKRSAADIRKQENVCLLNIMIIPIESALVFRRRGLRSRCGYGRGVEVASEASLPRWVGVSALVLSDNSQSIKPARSMSQQKHREHAQ
jgi:hypothetical protein